MPRMLIGAVLLWMSVLSVYDVRQRRLPNVLTLPGAGVILAVAALTGHGLPALAGAAALAGLYLLVHLAAPTGMGAGDVKLALGLGAVTGCFGGDVWFLAAIGAPLLTAVIGAVLWLRGVRSVPHGPSMCLASAAALGLAVLPPIDNPVIPGHTHAMKTAISLPDETFDRASRRASDLGMSRSEFFARAAQHYLDELDNQSLTGQIDSALAHLAVTDEAEAAATASGHRVLDAVDDEW